MPPPSSSPFRLRVPRGRNADWPAPPRPKGSRRPHTDAKVARVRRLIERTTLTYGEIAARTGVGRASICRWTRDGKWQRPLFAPRATDTVRKERAGAQLRMRTLAARLAALAERYIRELEETPGVDLDKLGEALALYQMAKLAARPRKRRPKPPRSSWDPNFQRPDQRDFRDRPPGTPIATRLLSELAQGGVDLYVAPHEAMKDYIESRRYTDLTLRPRNKTRRQRYTAWMLEPIKK